MDDDPVADAAAPNCPRDLVPMEIDGDADHPRWRCPECGLVQL